MNKFRVSSVSLAVAMLSAASTLGLAATSRVRFDDYTGKGLGKLTAEGTDDEPGAGDKTAVDTSTNVVGTGVNTEQLQQDQANSTIIGQAQQQQGGPGAPQPDAVKVDSAIKVAGSIVDQTQQQQQQGGPGAPQADAEPKAGIEVKAAETKLDDPAAGERQLG